MMKKFNLTVNDEDGKWIRTDVMYVGSPEEIRQYYNWISENDDSILPLFSEIPKFNPNRHCYGIKIEQRHDNNYDYMTVTSGDYVGLVLAGLTNCYDEVKTAEFSPFEEEGLGTIKI